MRRYALQFVFVLSESIPVDHIDVSARTNLVRTFMVVLQVMTSPVAAGSFRSKCIRRSKIRDRNEEVGKRIRPFTHEPVFRLVNRASEFIVHSKKYVNCANYTLYQLLHICSN